MDDPIAASTPDQPSPSQPPAQTPAPLPVEETPEIVPMPEHPTLPKKSGSFLKTSGTVIVFLALFIVGIWLSSFLREFFPSGGNNASTPTPIQSGPTPTGSAARGSGAIDPYASWKTYEVISGVTKLAVAGVSFKLPEDVLSPICDGSGCASQGTYLPGGSRFTVAPRGTGQTLRDFRGTVISDVNGTPFTTKNVTVAGRPATEFTGGFSGRTVSGYAFNKMRGVMIELSPSLSLEINHFTPSGITSDFAADDVLFGEILKTVTLAGYAAATQAPTPISTSAASIAPTKTATSSGN